MNICFCFIIFHLFSYYIDLCDSIASYTHIIREMKINSTSWEILYKAVILICWCQDYWDVFFFSFLSQSYTISWVAKLFSYFIDTWLTYNIVWVSGEQRYFNTMHILWNTTVRFVNTFFNIITIGLVVGLQWEQLQFYSDSNSKVIEYAIVDCGQHALY